MTLIRATFPWLQRAGTLAFVLGLFFCLSAAPAGYAAAPDPGGSGAAAGETRLILILRGQTALSQIAAPNLAGGNRLSQRAMRAQRVKSVVTALQAQAAAAQPSLLKRLEPLRAAGKIRRIQPMWIVNAVAVTVQPDAAQTVVSQLAALPEVASVEVDWPLRLTDSIRAAPQNPTLTVNANITAVGAPAVWAAGFEGQGIVVANVDTGVSGNNPSLMAKWRGGANSWFDVRGQYAVPTDVEGHGTATMGIMVGDGIGMAPKAKWIAVKMFDDTGNANISDALTSFQWILAPGGNPANAPDVVNNSWSETTAGCINDSTMHTALQALLAANILPVFSSGNIGGKTPSDPYPSNYPEVLAVGAVDSSNVIADFSSRGPTTCRPAGQFFPDLVGPGVSIQSADIVGGTANNLSGTSFSAPHVAGALALLLNAFPNLTPGEQRLALVHSAVDLGPAGPDNTYGYGGLDVFASYQWLVKSGPSTIYLPVVADFH